jgi:CRISPR-associated endonuclease Cas1
MSEYSQSPFALQSAQVIIEAKIRHRSALLARYKQPRSVKSLHRAESAQDILLYEARAAKQFWAAYRMLLPEWVAFTTRKPRSKDSTNVLLDIGYHHLTNKIIKKLAEKDITTALGLLHKPRTASSAPLAYDLVELFRADIVDAEVLSFLRLKKKPIVQLTQKDIAHFLQRVNKRLLRKHYLRDFKQCHTYEYYMDLQLIKFIKAINHNEVFKPLWLPRRHDSRCA